MKIYNIEQGTQEWLDLRRGKLTGTSTKNVVGYREMLKADLINVAKKKGLEFDEKKVKVDELKYLIESSDPEFSFRVMEAKFNKDFEYKMVALELTGKVDEGEQVEENPLERGHRLEPEARKVFEEKTGKKVDEVGFVTLDEEERVGLSPDGLIKNGGEYTEGLEIKCPCAWKFIKYWVEDRVPEEYKEQVLDYFVQNDSINKVYLVIYNPQIEIHPYHVFEITRDQYSVDIIILKEAQLKFWREHDERVKAIKELATKQN